MNKKYECGCKEYDTVSELDIKRLTPYIQPILSDKLDIYGGEVLLRYQLPNGTICPASKFINKLASSGLLPDVTSYILSDIIKNERDLISNYHIFINTTPQLFEDKIFINDCINIAQKNKFKLVLELTEQEPFLEEGRGTSMIKSLSKLGIMFALDDFGTGCSVLSYLKHLPIDYIKIDKLFIQDALFDVRSRIIIDAIIRMSENMNIRVIAEGIENEKQFNVLKKLGVKYFQGYHLGKPMSLTSFIGGISKKTISIHDDLL